MKELRGTEWYGEYATLTDEHNDYIQIEYKCNGTGRLYDYALFPGIDLIFMDFNCPDTFHEPIPNKNIIEIRHYQKGRVEFELRNNKVFHMKEGEFCINALANVPAAYSFPFGNSVGLSCVIDKDSVDSETQQLFSYYNIDVLNLGRELELEKKWFLCRTPQRLLHIFEELYAAKGSEGRDYFRIKLLELFYHIKQFIGGASCSECSLARFLDDRAFGDRIGKRDTDLDQVGTGFFHGDQQIFCGFKVWIPTCYKRDKCFFIFECLIYITHRYPLLCIVQWQPRLCRRVLK